MTVCRKTLFFGKLCTGWESNVMFNDEKSLNMQRNMLFHRAAFPAGGSAWPKPAWHGVPVAAGAGDAQRVGGVRRLPYNELFLTLSRCSTGAGAGHQNKHGLGRERMPVHSLTTAYIAAESPRHG